LPGGILHGITTISLPKTYLVLLFDFLSLVTRRAMLGDAHLPRTSGG